MVRLHGTERQAHIRTTEAEQSARRFDRNRIDLRKERVNERQKGELNASRTCRISLKEAFTKQMGFPWQEMGDNGDHSAPAKG